MKNLSLCVLVAFLIQLLPITTHAGYSVKKHQSATLQLTNATNTLNEIKAIQTQQTSETLHQLASPAFVNLMNNGTIGVIAFFCGIIGFFAPIFAVAAVMLGFIGLLRKNNKNKGMATFGLILGIAAILISIFGAFAPLPIF